MRGQDDDGIIATRMAEAVQEMSHYVTSDFLIVNDNFEQALVDMQSVVYSQRLSTEKQRETLAPLLQQLLA